MLFNGTLRIPDPEFGDQRNLRRQLAITSTINNSVIACKLTTYAHWSTMNWTFNVCIEETLHNFFVANIGKEVTVVWDDDPTEITIIFVGGYEATQNLYENDWTVTFNVETPTVIV